MPCYSPRPRADHLSLMSWQSGDTVQFLGKVVLITGRSVVMSVWGQCGLEGSFTTHWSAASSQLEVTSPLGSTQSSAVLLVQVPVPKKGHNASRPGHRSQRVPSPPPHHLNRA